MPRTATPRVVRDSAGKKASVRTSAVEGAELIDTDTAWNWYTDPRTGRYFVVSR